MKTSLFVWLLSARSQVAALRLEAAGLLDGVVAASEGEADTAAEDGLVAAAEEGKKLLAQSTCEQLTAEMSAALDGGRKIIEQMSSSDAGFRSLSTVKEKEELLAAGELLMAVGAAADNKRCLTSVMADQEVQEKLKALLDFEDQVLTSGHDDAADAALNSAWENLIAWQRGTLDLADPRLERTVRFPEDIEENCPHPCSSCSKAHNSRRKGEELFEFKCYLAGADRKSPPVREGMRCTKPRRRTSRFWKFWRMNQWKTWCTVDAWKDTACKQVHVTSMLSCGAAAIVNPLRESFTDLFYMHQRCVQYEQGVVKDARAMQNFQGQLMSDYKAVSTQHSLAFGIFLSAGLSSGLAALRWGSFANTSWVPDSATAAQPEDLLQPFLRGRVIDDALRLIFNGTELNECDGLVAEMATCKSLWRKKLAERGLESARWWQHFVASAAFGIAAAVTAFLVVGALMWGVFSLLAAFSVATGLSVLSGVPAGVLGLLSGIAGVSSFGYLQRLRARGGDPVCPSWSWGRRTWSEVLEDPLTEKDNVHLDPHPPAATAAPTPAPASTTATEAATTSPMPPPATTTVPSIRESAGDKIPGQNDWMVYVAAVVASLAIVAIGMFIFVQPGTDDVETRRGAVSTQVGDEDEEEDNQDEPQEESEDQQ